MHSARLLNPDRETPLILEFSTRFRLGQQARAQAVLEQLLRIEPDNAQAWDVLSRLTAQRDPRRSAEAVARVRQLDPRANR